jgi:hypothetical protein
LKKKISGVEYLELSAWKLKLAIDILNPVNYLNEKKKIKIALKKSFLINTENVLINAFVLGNTKKCI